MWSEYDTLILVTGILFLVVAALPFRGAPSKYRIRTAILGAVLVVLSLILGSLQSFTYPSMVTVGPVFPIIWAIALFADGLRRDRLAKDSAPLPAPAMHPRIATAFGSTGASAAVCTACQGVLAPVDRFCTTCGHPR